MNTKKHNIPKNKILRRILKLIRAVAATVGKNIRKRISQYTGGLIFGGGLAVPTNIFPSA